VCVVYVSTMAQGLVYILEKHLGLHLLDFSTSLLLFPPCRATPKIEAISMIHACLSIALTQLRENVMWCELIRTLVSKRWGFVIPHQIPTPLSVVLTWHDLVLLFEERYLLNPNHLILNPELSFRGRVACYITLYLESQWICTYVVCCHQ
jgi:hypothetical protein